MQDEFVTASEAIKLLKITPSMFYRWVNQGKITKYLPTPGSIQGLYSTRDIARYQRQQEIESKPRESAATDWLRVSDLGNLYNLEIAHYGDDTGDPSVVKRWLACNPYLGRVVFNANDRRDLWGAIILLPMRERTIMRILRREMRDVDIKPEYDLQMYDEGTYDLYAASAIIREDKREHFPMLLRSWVDFFANQLPGLQIGRVYARILSDSGLLMVKKLFFSPIRHIADNAWELDMSSPNPSRIIQSLQICMKTSKSA